jgi:ABC-type nitrate/sulfonate/bicarbonate transport system substrate-binding protein
MLAAARGATSVRLTLPWLVQGAAKYCCVAREMSAFAPRGLLVEVSRGPGSVATAQAVAQGRSDFEIVGAGPLILARCAACPWPASPRPTTT